MKFRVIREVSKYKSIGKEWMSCCKERQNTCCYRSGIWYKGIQISKLGYKTSEDVISRHLWDILVLGYFSQKILANI